jgi:cytochrome b subunit of formate dehydrogenase
VGIWNAHPRSKFLTRIPNSKFQIPNMRFIHFYLVTYFILLIAAGLALWRAGVLARIDEMWLALAIVIAATPAIILTIMSMTETTIRRE